MSNPNAIDSLIGTFEGYVLAKDKQTYVKTLVQNSGAYKMIAIVHEIHSRGDIVSAELKEMIKSWRSYHVSNDRDKMLLLRSLLVMLSNERDAAKAKELILELDNLTEKKHWSLYSQSKPIILASSEGFKEQKELNLPTSVRDKPESHIFFKNFIAGIYEEPGKYLSQANPSLYYLLDLEKIAKKDPHCFERILKQLPDYTNLKNLPDACEQMVKRKRKEYKYYEMDVKYFKKMNLAQLVAVGKIDKPYRRNAVYCQQVYLKTFDVTAADPDRLGRSERLQRPRGSVREDDGLGEQRLRLEHLDGVRERHAVLPAGQRLPPEHLRHQALQRVPEVPQSLPQLLQRRLPERVDSADQVLQEAKRHAERLGHRGQAAPAHGVRELRRVRAAGHLRNDHHEARREEGLAVELLREHLPAEDEVLDRPGSR